MKIAMVVFLFLIEASKPMYEIHVINLNNVTKELMVKEKWSTTHVTSKNNTLTHLCQKP
jgi:hypothetical protein